MKKKLNIKIKFSKKYKCPYCGEYLSEDNFYYGFLKPRYITDKYCKECTSLSSELEKDWFYKESLYW